MKFGVNTFIWTVSFERAHLPLLPAIKEHGFDGIEVALFRPANFATADIHRGIKENDLECTICGVLPKDLSVISDDSSTRRETFSHMKDCVKTAAEVGAGIIAGPLYSPVGYLPGRRRTSDEWKRAVDFYQQLGPVLDSYNVEIGIEPLNRFETYFLNTAEDAVALCEAIGHPKVGILFDTFHANIEEKRLGDAFRKVGPYLKHVHACENDRGTPGTGHIAWNDVFEALRAVKYDRWLTIESFGFTVGEISAAASIWRDLAPTPESIAFEGVKFLKRHMA